MVKSGGIPHDKNLRLGQLWHTAVILVFFVYIALNPAFLVKVDSGQSFRILAAQGLIGAFLLWSAVLVIAAQVIGFRRFSILSTVAYALTGASLLFLGVSVPAGESVLNSQIDGVSLAIDWIITESKSDFEVAKVNIQIGSAWKLMLIAGMTLTCLSFALLLGAHRGRGKSYLDKPLG
jgi:hypothetical protein